MLTKNVEPSATTKNSDYSEVRASIDEAYNHLKEAGASVKQAAHAAGSYTSEMAHDQFQAGKSKVSTLSDEASAAVRNQPLAVAGVAFLAGCLAALLLKR